MLGYRLSATLVHKCCHFLTRLASLQGEHGWQVYRMNTSTKFQIIQSFLGLTIAKHMYQIKRGSAGNLCLKHANEWQDSFQDIAQYTLNHINMRLKAEPINSWEI